jgi:hypothetical protein
MNNYNDDEFNFEKYKFPSICEKIHYYKNTKLTMEVMRIFNWGEGIGKWQMDWGKFGLPIKSSSAYNSLSQLLFCSKNVGFHWGKIPVTKMHMPSSYTISRKIYEVKS